MYTSSRATTSAVPHVRQTSVAVVISTPNSSSIMPPIALPSRRRSSATSRSETLGPDRQRLVAERNQPIGGDVDKARRAAHEDVRLFGRRPGHLAQHLGVDSARIAGPPRRLLPGQGVEDLHPFAGASVELLAVDHILEPPRGVEEADRRRLGRRADYRHQRDDTGAAADEEDGAAVVLP